ncbi:MAG: CRISPR-associated helicase Cas3' [Clostridiales bacterium]|jgi:CRISPR-associated endonuclease/helicase Cas3|nr:CRISPR-associated helicase Cas3' [Clostridiales bacterium]
MSAEKQAYIAHRREDDGAEQSVIDHLIGTAELARRNADIFGGGEMAYAAARLHDIGKYSKQFQKRIRGGGAATDHSTAGGQLLYTSHAKSRMCNLATLAAYCVMGHHTGLPDGGTSVDSPEDATLRGRLNRVVEDYSAYQDEYAAPPLSPPAFSPDDGFGAAFFTRMIFSALVDADYLDTERFMQKDSPARGGPASLLQLLDKLMASIEPYLHPAGPVTALDAMRTGVLKSCLSAAELACGLFTLTAPTGSGKTIASLAFALAHAVKRKKRRIIFIVPYNTIIEQNAGVFENILGSESVLQHHSNVLYDDTKSEELSRKRHSTENWDYPLIVTSSVQFFESLFANRSSQCRKLHNIADSVLIFDEAQMLPTLYLLPCVRAIRELTQYYGCSTVLATATQSSLERFFAPLAPTEIAKDTKKLYAALRRAAICRIPDPLTDDELAARLDSHVQVLCIVNSRRQAQALFEKLRGITPSPESVFHLSTTMYPAHRSRVLADIKTRLKENRPCRVVSTSLVECGVDFDFPHVYREEAGLDSVIQAAGRCNREGLLPKEQAIVYVFTSADHKPPRSIQANIDAYRQIARNFEDVAGLDAIRSYFEQLFYNKGDGALDQKQILKMFEDGRASRNFPFKTAAELFRLIDDRRMRTVFVLGEAPELENRLRAGERTREIFRALGQYAISLYRDPEIDALCRLGAVEFLDDEALLLTGAYYDEHFGVSLSPQGGKGLFVE